MPVDAGHPRGGGQAAARGGEGPLPPAPPPPPGGREGRPASARPRSARAGHIPALPPRRRRSPGPARRLTSAGTGRFSAAAFSSSTESVCLSVSGALVSGLRSHRASFSRESRSAAGSAGSSSAASAIAAAPRPSAAPGRWGPTERPGPLPGEPGLPALHRQRGGPSELTRKRFRGVGGTASRTDVALHPVRLFPVAMRSQRAKAIHPDGNRNAPTGSLNINNFIVRGVHDNCAK